jgi:putative ABC transport system ATP-binding protein
MRAAKLAEFRRTHLGFIFQDFNLLEFSLMDNVSSKLKSWKMNPKCVRRNSANFAARI